MAMGKILGWASPPTFGEVEHVFHELEDGQVVSACLLVRTAPLSGRYTRRTTRPCRTCCARIAQQQREHAHDE